MRCPVFLLGLLCLCLPDRPARAELVLSITGPLGVASVFIGGYDGSVLTDSWTSNTAFDGVTIAASIGTLDAGSDHGTAYLTTTIGPEATPATLVASAVFTAPLTATYGAPVANTVLFSGLNLPAATYYLSLTSPEADNGFLYWNALGSTAVTIQTAPGVGGITAYGSSDGAVASYAPASNFFVSFDTEYVDIISQPVPEPGSAVLLLTPMLLLGGMAVKRSRSRLLHQPRQAVCRCAVTHSAVWSCRASGTLFGEQFSSHRCVHPVP